VRSTVLSERELDYVAAAKLRDEGAAHILFVEILPNIASSILVEATVRLGYAIFAVATLSFLGFGIQPPSPDWGLSISQSYGMISGGYWWLVLFNAIAIASLVVGVNLVADGVQSVYES
jgi:peptide/nickel transport system permease protein